MKKTFEFFIILIIFYGVYAAFEKAAPLVFDQPKSIWVILSSLVVAALILVLYSAVVGSSVKAKMKSSIDELKTEIKNKEALISKKEQEVKKAQSFKEDLIKEAESTIVE